MYPSLIEDVLQHYAPRTFSLFQTLELLGATERKPLRPGLYVIETPFFVSSQIVFFFQFHWILLQGFGQPHDVTSDQDGAVYVADIGKNTVWKFKRQAWLLHRKNVKI